MTDEDDNEDLPDVFAIGLGSGDLVFNKVANIDQIQLTDYVAIKHDVAAARVYRANGPAVYKTTIAAMKLMYKLDMSVTILCVCAKQPDYVILALGDNEGIMLQNGANGMDIIEVVQTGTSSWRSKDPSKCQIH